MYVVAQTVQFEHSEMKQIYPANTRLCQHLTAEDYLIAISTKTTKCT
jgi:hypothetical protein